MFQMGSAGSSADLASLWAQWPLEPVEPLPGGSLPTLLPGSPGPPWPRMLAGLCVLTQDPHQCPSSSQPLALAAPIPTSTL